MNISIFSKLECKGGSEWRNYEYAKGFIQSGHDVRIYCYRHYNPLLKERLTSEIGEGWLNNLHENMRFKIDCRNDEILIITPTDEGCFRDPNWLNMHITNKEKIKKVFVVINWGSEDAIKIKETFDCPVVFLCANKEYQQKFANHGLNAVFIHTPISNEFYDIKPDYSNCIIGRHSRSFDYKFAESYVKLIKEHQEYNFLIMGISVKYVKMLQEMPNLNILKEFILDSPEYLKRIGIFLQINNPSLFEMSPRVVVEAMMAGLPVLTEKKGGAKDQIIHGENGFLWETYEDIEMILKRLVDSKDLRTEIGMKAKEFAFKNNNAKDRLKEFEEMFNA